MFWLLIGCGPSAEVPLAAEVVVTPIGTPRTPAVRDYALELSRVDALLTRQQAAAETRSGAASVWLALSSTHLSRARLIGGVADYVAAEEAVNRAVSIAPDAPAVWRQRARVLQSRHHFREALALLQRLPSPTAADRSAMASMTFELGSYEPAVKTLQSLSADPRDPATPARLAACLSRLGQFDEADRYYEVAASRYHGREKWPVAWNHLMRGLMDLTQEHYDAALVHYSDADRALPGWWLVQEHIAEVYVLQGRAKEAVPIYEKVLEATDSPELIGAYADALLAAGESQRAVTEHARALKAFTDRLKSHPDLAGGHALTYLLEHGDPALALQVAQRNERLRPNGEAKLLLAEALDRNNDHDAATSLREQVLASGWWTGP